MLGLPAPIVRQPVTREPPPLDAHVELPAGSYAVGEPGAELDSVLLGRWPVVNAHARRFVEETRRGVPAVLAAKLADPQLANHPATDVSLADALAFCAWATQRRGRDVFEVGRCVCAEAGWGWTMIAVIGTAAATWPAATSRTDRRCRGWAGLSRSARHAVAKPRFGTPRSPAPVRRTRFAGF